MGSLQIDAVARSIRKHQSSDSLLSSCPVSPLGPIGSKHKAVTVAQVVVARDALVAQSVKHHKCDPREQGPSSVNKIY